jgi:3-phosphoshikimate 1-carboxyvinyltransferase
MEIKPIRHIDRTVTIPGSKSYSQRSLVIAALAEGESVLYNCLKSDDTDYLIGALRLLGAEIREEAGKVCITGTGGRISAPGRELYLGNNGTALRLLTGLAALGRGEFVITGDSRLCERPVKPLLDALHSLGVRVETRDGAGYPPVTVHADAMKGGHAVLSNIDSSQYVSSLLIALPLCNGNSIVEIEGNIPSRPYVSMTLDTMKDFGVQAGDDNGRVFSVRGGQRYTGRSYAVEGDASSASYFFLAAALTRGTVRVENINPGTRQGDIGILSIMEKLGMHVTGKGQAIILSGGDLAKGDYAFDMGNMPDMVPTLAVLSAVRQGRTMITNAAHLRIKESNRLAALVSELRKVGARAEETEDGLAIEGGDLHGAEIETYNDHRIAMSFAMLGLLVPGIKISNPACVGKSFPGFWKEIENWY